jgi:hypothetical protein
MLFAIFTIAFGFGIYISIISLFMLLMIIGIGYIIYLLYNEKKNLINQNKVLIHEVNLKNFEISTMKKDMENQINIKNCIIDSLKLDCNIVKFDMQFQIDRLTYHKSCDYIKINQLNEMLNEANIEIAYLHYKPAYKYGAKDIDVSFSKKRQLIYLLRKINLQLNKQ